MQEKKKSESIKWKNTQKRPMEIHFSLEYLYEWDHNLDQRKT